MNDRSNLTGSGVSGGGGQENSQVPKAVDPPSNKKLIECLGKLQSDSRYMAQWDFFADLASALEEREGMEAAVQKIAEGTYEPIIGEAGDFAVEDLMRADARAALRVNSEEGQS